MIRQGAPKRLTPNLMVLIVGSMLLLVGIAPAVEVREFEFESSIDDLVNIEQSRIPNHALESRIMMSTPIPFEVISEGVDIIRASDGHRYGLTGEGIRVAVIDLGFDISSEEIRGNVVEFREFTGDGIAAEDRSHGTAVAEIVVDTAPNTELYLYRIDGPRTFLEAVNAAVLDQVDILSLSIGFINLGPYDGSSSVSLALDEVRELGILPIVAAGNFGRNHWGGFFRDVDQNGMHEFAESIENNFLNVTRDDLIQIELSWDDWPISERDYDLFLLNPESIIVASSTNDQSRRSLPPVESISHVARSTGSYSIQIRSSNSRLPVSGDLDFFHLFLLTHNLERYVEERSIGNLADSKGALTVGASSLDDDVVESFSSKGPTSDGRIKPDLVAPNAVSVDSLESSFRGTSPSAPYVAGLAALLLEANRDLTPDDIQILLEASAVDLGPRGKDSMSGSGRAELRFLLLDSERGVSVDGQLYPNEDLPKAFVWPLGSSHSISVTPLVDFGEGERQRFLSWSDGATNSLREFLYDPSVESLTAEFGTEFFLTIESPFGEVVGGGWHLAGSEILISVTPEEEYDNGTRVRFERWRGDIESSLSSISITVESPVDLEAIWAVQYFLEVQGNGGNATGGGWYDVGDIAILEVRDPTPLDEGSRLLFLGWTGDIISIEKSLRAEVNRPMRVSANWQTQYFLRVESSLGDAQGEGWYNAGDIGVFSVSPREGFLGQSVFERWLGDSDTSNPMSSVLMDSPRGVDAIWRTDYTNLLLVGGILSTIVVIVIISVIRFSKEKPSSSS